MPMALAETIDIHHEDLLRTLDEAETLIEARAPGDALPRAVGTVRRRLLAHRLTAERFVVGPLRQLQLLDPHELADLDDELDHLTRDAVSLTSGRPDVTAVAAFLRRVRAHIERKARAVVPTARFALGDGRLTAVPGWRLDEFYGLQGGPSERRPEEWLG
jgi:hypothetical protein